MSAENKLYFQAEKEAIFLLLTGIGDEIYSTVDACNTANEMWIAIERLQQGESLNVQDVKTNLFWEFGKFTSRDGESMESYYSRFYKLMNELTRNNLQVTTMQSVSDEDSDPEQAQRDKEMQKNWHPCKECGKLKRVKDYTYHKEKMMMCKQAEQGVPLQAEQADVNHSTSVSRPPLKSYQVKDKVVPNNSQVKFTKKEVEDHHRISSISKKTKSVTAYNDSSNSRTSNVNAVCAECGKCVFNSNHDACVSKYLNDEMLYL
ncbi:hypothetical protein Tco_0320067 [Tanacetum coccineum]